MPARFRRTAFLVALLVSAAVYAYSLAGIAATGDELRSAVSAQTAERSTPVSYGTWGNGSGDCPASAEPDSSVRL
jgi:hypothetical protein